MNYILRLTKKFCYNFAFFSFIEDSKTCYANLRPFKSENVIINIIVFVFFHSNFCKLLLSLLSWSLWTVLLFLFAKLNSASSSKLISFLGCIIVHFNQKISELDCCVICVHQNIVVINIFFTLFSCFFFHLHLR